MRVAVIGCGSIGTRHARNLTALGHRAEVFDLEAGRAFHLAVDLHGGNYSKAAFCPTDDWATFGAYGSDARQLPDAAMICTPASTHAAVARELLEHGYRGPLFVEKPLALSVEDCAVFRSWPHPTTMVGYNWRFNREVKQWRDAIVEVDTFHLTCNTDMATWPGAVYGDPLLECSHELDLLCSWRAPMVPHVYRVTAQADCVGTLIEFHIGDTVRLRWNGPPSRAFRIETGDASKRLWPSVAPVEQSYIDELAHFLSCAHTGAATTTPFSDGERVLQIISQVKEMATA